MNNKIRIALSLTCISSHIVCMDSEQRQEYRNKCLEIRQKYEQKLQQYHGKFKNQTFQDLRREKNNIENTLQNDKKNIITRTHKLLANVQQDHKIDEVIWKECQDCIRNTLNQHEANLHLSSPTAYHDTTLHKNIYAILIEKLQNHGINPQRITIRKEETPHIYITSFFSHTNAIEININENNFLMLSDSHQNAACHCVAEQITHGLPFIPLIITHHKSLQTNFIMNSQELMRLQDMCINKASVFLACFNDPDTASSMMQFIPDYCDNFSVRDYQRICKINMCWKRLEWIKPYNFIISVGTLIPKLAKINGAISDNSLSDNSLS